VLSTVANPFQATSGTASSAAGWSNPAGQQGIACHDREQDRGVGSG
jgi:hypothetical protein